MKYKFLKPFFKLLGKLNWERIIPVIVIVFLVLIVFVWPIPPFGKNEATLILDINGQKRTFAGETFKEMTILDAINASNEAGGINFKYAINKNDIQMIDINGYSSDHISYKFTFYLNSQPINGSDINKIQIRPGDKIEIRVK